MNILTNKNLSLSLLILLMMTNLIISDAKAQNFQGSVSYLAPGTSIEAVINETLSSEFTRIGEILRLPVTSPVYGPSGVVIPSGAIVEAQVVNVSPAGRAGKSGSIDLKLSALIAPNGSRVPISASLDHARFSLSANNSGRVEHYAKATAAGAAGGALSGLIGGAISGGKVGRGAALGTAVGGGLGILGGTLKKGKELIISKGTPLPFKLDQALSLSSGAAPNNTRFNEYPESSYQPNSYGSPQHDSGQHYPRPPMSPPPSSQGYQEIQNPYY